MFYDILHQNFEDNKYLRWYIAIVSNKEMRSKKEPQYYEEHHILPKSLFADYKNLRKNKWNRVLLTAKEHFICHWLLTKVCKNEFQYQKMLKAFVGMTRNKNGNRKLTSFEYSKLKEKASFSMSIMRKGQPSWNTGKTGLQVAWNKGLKYSSGPRKEGTGKNISEAKRNAPRVECIYCGKITDPANNKKYHGEMCKLNPNIDPKILEERSRSAKENIRKQKEIGTFQSSQERLRRKGSDPHAHNHKIHECPTCGKQGKQPGIFTHIRSCSSISAHSSSV
jgi:ribosomal protein L37AE/L43A